MSIKRTSQHFILIMLLGLCFMGCTSEKKQLPNQKVAAPSSIEPRDTLPKRNNPDSQNQHTTLSVTTAKADVIDDTAVTESPNSTPSKSKVKRPKKKAKIQFAEEIWDFGEISEGDVIEKKFKFTNSGDAPLQIFEARGSCGCTLPSFPFLDILPGESNEVGVTYNSVGKNGAQTAEITIKSNANPRITTLKLKGIVIPKEK